MRLPLTRRPLCYATAFEPVKTRSRDTKGTLVARAVVVAW